MGFYLNLKQFEDNYLSDNDTLCSLTSISSISSDYSSNACSLDSLAESLSEKSSQFYYF